MLDVGLNKEGCVLVVIEETVRMKESRVGLVRCGIVSVDQFSPPHLRHCDTLTCINLKNKPNT